MKRPPLLIILLLFALVFASTIGSVLANPASEDSYMAPRNTLSYSTNNANSLIVDASPMSYSYFDFSNIFADAVMH